MEQDADKCFRMPRGAAEYICSGSLPSTKKCVKLGLGVVFCDSGMETGSLGVAVLLSSGLIFVA